MNSEEFGRFFTLHRFLIQAACQFLLVAAGICFGAIVGAEGEQGVAGLGEKANRLGQHTDRLGFTHDGKLPWPMAEMLA